MHISEQASLVQLCVVCVFIVECCAGAWASTLPVASWNEQLSDRLILTVPSPHPRFRPQRCEPVATDDQSPPRCATTPHLRPLTPSPSVLFDHELQEAFRECEEQMASLFTPTEPVKVYGAEKTGGEVMVKGPSESSSPPPIVVQPGHSNGSHGNKSTHGNSEGESSQPERVVFSFRNYILGYESNAGTAETGREITVDLDKCSEIMPEKERDQQKETSLPTQSEITTDFYKDPLKNDDVSEHRGGPIQEHVAAEENSTAECDTVAKEEMQKATTDAANKKSKNENQELTVNICKGETNVDNSFIECTTHLSDASTVETKAGTDQNKEESQSESKTDKQSCSTRGTQDGQNKEAKKRKHRRKKKVEKVTETEQQTRTVGQSENEVQDVGTRTDSSEKGVPVSEAGTHTVICGEQADNRFDYKQQKQLSPGGILISSPLASSVSSQDHLTALVNPPASIQTLSQMPHQSDDHNQMDVQSIINHCSRENSLWEQHAAGGENTPTTNVQATAMKPVASSDRISDAHTQEAIVTTEVKILAQENQSPLSKRRTSVGESCVDSAHEKALMVVAALPLTTPTLPEVIESQGEGESMRHDFLETVDTVAFAESEKEIGEGELRCVEKNLSSADGEKNELVDAPPQLSLICSQGKYTLAFSAEEGQSASEKSCSSKMPHNVSGTEMRRLAEMSICSSDADITPAEEGGEEKEPLRLETCISASLLGLLTGPDCQERCAAGSQRLGGGGGTEEVGEKGGPTGEHSSFSQPEGSVRGVSSAETEMHPPTDVAESQLKSQSRSEPIATITEDICCEQDRLFHPCQERRGEATSPLSALSERSSSDANEGITAHLMQKPLSEEALPLGSTCVESSITEANSNQVFLSPIPSKPSPSSQQNKQQASNNQQVQPSSTTGAKAQTQSKGGTSGLSGVDARVYDNGEGNNRVHFADGVKQDSGSSVDLKNMSVPVLDCASLPPLTVHECLHHPVVEACYTFSNFLSLKKPEIPTNSAPSKNEAAIYSPADFQKPQKDVQLDKRDGGTNDTKNKTDHSGYDSLETNTVNLQTETEANSKELSCPTVKNQADNEDYHTETVKLHAAPEDSGGIGMPQEPSLIHDTVISEEKEGSHDLPSVLPDDDGVTCKPVSTEALSGQPSADLDSSSKSKSVTSICETPPQPTSPGPSFQPPSQLDEMPPSGLVTMDLMMASKGSADPPKDESETASEQSNPAISHSHNNPPFVLRPPGPMLSHLEFITDSDILLPEQTDNRSADGDCTNVSREVDGNKSSGMTLMSLAQDLEHSNVSVKTDEICQELEGRNNTAQSVGEAENSVSDNINMPSSPEENVPHVVQSLGATALLSKDESDNVISSCHTEPDSVGADPVTCEMSIRDGLVMASCSVTSKLPASKMHDEVKEDNMEANNKMGDQAPLVSEEKEKQNEEATTDNQKKEQWTGKTGSTLQYLNEPEKEAAVDAGDLQSPDKHKILPQSRRGKKEGERKKSLGSTSETETSSSSPKRTSETTEDLTSTELESSSKTQTVYDLDLNQTLTAMLECSSDAASDLKPALSQSQSSLDLNCFAQQQEQCLGSRHSTEELSGGFVEAEQKTNSQNQAAVSGVKGLAEEGDGSVESLFQSESKDELRDDQSGGNDGLMGQEKSKGAQALSGATNVDVPCHFSSDSLDTGIAVYSQAGVTKEGMDENKDGGLGVDEMCQNLKPNIEIESELGSKAQPMSNLSAACQDLHRKSETSENNIVPSDLASQQLEISPPQNSVSSKVGADSHDDTEICSANAAEESIHGTLPDHAVLPETGENDLKSAMAMKSKGGENEQCEITDTVPKTLEAQSCNKTAATQASTVVQTAVKGPDAEEITKEDEAALVEETASSQGKEQWEVKESGNKEEMEKWGVGNVNAKDSSIESVSVDFQAGVSQSRAVVCPSEVEAGLFKGEEHGSDISDKVTADLCVVSNHPEDLPSTTFARLDESVEPHDKVSLSKPHDDLTVKPPITESQCDEVLAEKAPACNSAVEQVSVNNEADDVPESRASAETSQEPDTSWIKALKEAASHCQSEQVKTVDASR